MSKRPLTFPFVSIFLSASVVGIACGSSDNNAGSSGAAGAGGSAGKSVAAGGGGGASASAGTTGGAGMMGVTGMGAGGAPPTRAQCVAMYPEPSNAVQAALATCGCDAAGPCNSVCGANCRAGEPRATRGDACFTCLDDGAPEHDTCGLKLACETSTQCSTYADCVTAAAKYYGAKSAGTGGAGGAGGAGETSYPICDSTVGSPIQKCATCAGDMCCAETKTCVEDPACKMCAKYGATSACQSIPAYKAWIACMQPCAASCTPLFRKSAAMLARISHLAPTAKPGNSACAYVV